MKLSDAQLAVKSDIQEGMVFTQCSFEGCGKKKKCCKKYKKKAVHCKKCPKL